MKPDTTPAGREAAAQPGKPAKLSAYTEANAMAAAYDALAALDEDAQERAMAWLDSRLRSGRNDGEAPF